MAASSPRLAAMAACSAGSAAATAEAAASSSSRRAPAMSPRRASTRAISHWASVTPRSDRTYCAMSMLRLSSAAAMDVSPMSRSRTPFSRSNSACSGPTGAPCRSPSAMSSDTTASHTEPSRANSRARAASRWASSPGGAFRLPISIHLPGSIATAIRHGRFGRRECHAGMYCSVPSGVPAGVAAARQQCSRVARSFPGLPGAARIEYRVRVPPVAFVLTSMPRLLRVVFLALCAACALSACGRFADRSARAAQQNRVVSVSKQINEFLYAIGAQSDLVAVDLTSIYPAQIRRLPTVGYHRALSAEGIISMRPTLFLTDGNVGPDAVLQQLRTVGIPIEVMQPGGTLDSSQMLLAQLGRYFHHERAADSVLAQWKAGMQAVWADTARWNSQRHPRVLLMHFGQIINNYLAVNRGSPADQMIRWAGGANAM